MDLGLDGRAYVVGGASRGLGRAVAEELVRDGARVLLVARGAEGLEAAAGELGDAAFTCAVDMARPEAAGEIAQAVDERLGGRLDGVLVNHGGPQLGEALVLTDEEWRSAFELVLGGPIRLLRELEPRLADGGAIVFVTSSSMRRPVPGLDTSNVLRPGVAGLVKCLAGELGPRLRVASVGPGRFETERGMMFMESRAKAHGRSVEEEVAAQSAEVPLGRLGDPPEFARVVAFLLSPAASYVTGVNLLVDGGLVSALP